MSNPDDHAVNKPEDGDAENMDLDNMFPPNQESSFQSDPAADHSDSSEASSSADTDAGSDADPGAETDAPGAEVSGDDSHLTEPILPPPSGEPVAGEDPFAPTASPEAAGDEPSAEQPVPQQWVPQDAYDKERRRSRIFMGTTVVAAALLVGSLFYAAAQTGSSFLPTAGSDTTQGEGYGAPDGDGPNSDGRGPGHGRGGQFGGGHDGDGERDGTEGRGGPGGFIEHFFNSDGTLDEEEVTELQERLQDMGGSGFTDRLADGIDAAVENGLITQEQADQLLSVLGQSGTGTNA